MSNPIIKHSPLPALTITATLRAFVLVLCCLGGASGYTGFNAAHDDKLGGGPVHATTGHPLAPGQAHVADTIRNALLSSRQWGSGQTRLTASPTWGGDGAGDADDLATVRNSDPPGIIHPAQGYAPGTLVSIPSFYSATWSPRSPPQAS